MTIELKNLKKILLNVLTEIENSKYSSNDPYDLLGSGPIVWLRSRKSKTLNAITSKEPSKKERLVRNLISPIYQNSVTWKIYRKIFRIKPVVHPKTMGLMLQGYVSLYKTYETKNYLNKAKFCAHWLMNNYDQLEYGYYCWGLPFIWPSDDQIPKFGPQSTLSAVNGIGFVDLYEVTKEKKYLNVAISICNFFLNHLKIDKISNDKWAFSYTPYDKTHIINVNFHCAALLARVWQFTKNQDYYTTLIKICNYSVSEQRSDGAWHYSGKIDGFVNAVDNTHTGDNIEYLTIIRKVLKSNFTYEQEYQKGVNYYLNNFISSNGMPYYTDSEKYPIESHPTCQMLITLATLSNTNNKAYRLCEKLLYFIQKNMLNKQKTRLVYRIYETGRVDNNYYISWGDAWLIKGLSLFLKNMKI